MPRAGEQKAKGAHLAPVAAGGFFFCRVMASAAPWAGSEGSAVGDLLLHHLSLQQVARGPSGGTRGCPSLGLSPEGCLGSAGIFVCPWGRCVRWCLARAPLGLSWNKRV